MAGNTTRIDFSTLKLQWDSHSAMAAICTHWSITKDQLIRLKSVVPLAPRHDRRLRFKPKRSEYRDPTPQEIVERSAAVRAKWDERTERERRVVKLAAYRLPMMSTPDEAIDIVMEPVDE
jgi:hypothetical protein